MEGPCVAKSGSNIVKIVLAVGALAFTAGRAEAQTAGATVRASATIVSAVGVQAPSSLEVGSEGVRDFSLTGDLQVTSPAPHVLSAQVEQWGVAARRPDYARVRPGRLGTLPEEVRVRTGEGSTAGVVRVTYTVAVVL